MQLKEEVSLVFVFSNSSQWCVSSVRFFFSFKKLLLKKPRYLQDYWTNSSQRVYLPDGLGVPRCLGFGMLCCRGFPLKPLSICGGNKGSIQKSKKWAEVSCWPRTQTHVMTSNTTCLESDQLQLLITTDTGFNVSCYETDAICVKEVRLMFNLQKYFWTAKNYRRQHWPHLLT